MVPSRRGLSMLSVALLGIGAIGCDRHRATVATDAGRAGGPAAREGLRPADDPAATPPGPALGTGTSHRNIPVHPVANGDSEDETSIAVNPTDKLNLIASTRTTTAGGGAVAAYASLDGGLTWQGGVFDDDTYGFETDPVVAFCRDGTAYQVVLAVDGIGQPGAILVRRSNDGGVTWPVVRTVVESDGDPFLDKPWITCDRSLGSPTTNRLFVEWMELADLTLGRQRIMLSHSDDAGLNWSTPAEVSDGEAMQNQGVVAVGPTGRVFVVWNKILADESLALVSDRSLDGGTTWGTDTIVQIADPIPQDGPVLRATYPAMDIDRSGGRYNGRIYVAWSDQRFGDPDILMAWSLDGQSWSDPLRVNDDALGNLADQYHQWLTVDPKGRVVVAFWDRRRHIGSSRYEVWAAISRDGGRSFDTNFVVSDLPSDRDLNDFLGDYTGVAASEDALYPLWVDSRSGVFADGDIYTDAYPNVFDYDEVDALVWTDATTMTWQRQEFVFNQDIDYDILTGFVRDLRTDGGFDGTVCDAAAWDAPPFLDARLPFFGFTRYYLVRARGPSGVGSYGDGAPAARVNVRDRLDTDPICP